MPITSAPRALSLNWVLDRIYENFGASAREVEIKDFDLGQLIADRTIPSFSRYFPWQFPYWLKHDMQARGRVGYYYIDPQDVPTTVLGCDRMIDGIDPRPGLGCFPGRTYYSNNGPAISMNMGSFGNTLVDARELNDLLSATSLPVTVSFLAPNMIETFPKRWYDNSIVILNCYHQPTLHTIPMNMQDEFVKLAYLDFLLYLRPIYKKYSSIPTVFGELQIDTEAMDAAKDQRDDLLEKMRLKSQLRAGGKRWYIA